jgi:hypothetical protein
VRNKEAQSSRNCMMTKKPNPKRYKNQKERTSLRKLTRYIPAQDLENED